MEVRDGTLARPRVASLDGIRALAVLAVVFFHADASWARGGFLGVDAFFVLSGFLITGILLEEKERAGRIDVPAFWARRARRLLPALGLLIAVVGAVLLITGGRDGSFAADAVATISYVSNWHFLIEGGGYFAQTTAPSVLEHTWSLAIEEQFYLLWPLILVLATRARRARRALGIVAFVGAIGSMTLMAALAPDVGGDASRSYYGTDTRAQSLLIGALLAVLMPVLVHRVRPGRLRTATLNLVAFGSLAATAVMWFRLDATSPWLYRGGFTVASLATAGIIAGAVLLPRGLVARSLGCDPLRRLGRISYGVYLWHWPVQIGLTHSLTGLRGTPLIALRIGVTIGAAAVSFLLLEEPVRVRVRAVVPTLQASVAGAVALAAIIGVVARPADVFPVSVAAEVVEIPPAADVPARTHRPSSTTAPRVASRPAPARVAPLPPPPTPTYSVAFVGDSVSQSIADGSARIGPAYGLRIINDGTLGCGVARSGSYTLSGKTYKLANVCAEWPDTWETQIARDDPDVVAIVIGRHEVLDRTYRDRWTHVGDDAYDAYLKTELEQAVRSATTRGSRIALMTAPYYSPRERPDGGSIPRTIRDVSIASTI